MRDRLLSASSRDYMWPGELAVGSGKGQTWRALCGRSVRGGQTLLERHLLQWTHKVRREGQSRQADLQSRKSCGAQRSIASQIKVENPGIEITLPGVVDLISERTLSHKDSRLSVNPETEIYGSPSAKLASFSDCDDNEDVSILGTTTSSGLIERLSRLEKELKALRDESAVEIDFWKAKYRIADDKIAELERANNALVVRIGALMETRDQLTVTDFLKSQAMIDDLVKQIYSQRRVQTLKRRADVNVDRP
ncbi:hypothetical protein GJ744_006439 [Endocarpon pusillum]|uniref:Uncharacterized protein n=1 Tax=Endocarpon pusillum TaxID=364733 RepID=A0A8H7A6T6_9EURO|nr:hypothetical protein GJ744_006439 [Endocarpon pusillum]